MATRAKLKNGRFPTVGPVADDYDDYSHLITGDKIVLYDQTPGGWIQSTHMFTLDLWR